MITRFIFCSNLFVCKDVAFAFFVVAAIVFIVALQTGCNYLNLDRQFLQTFRLIFIHLQICSFSRLPPFKILRS